jgi:GAF domain-containing protein
MTESRGLRMVSDRISRARDLDELLTGTLAALDEVFGFTHSAILVPEDDGRLVTIASHGYGATSIGAEVHVGAKAKHHFFFLAFLPAFVESGFARSFLRFCSTFRCAAAVTWATRSA